jgi:hypothetical protein
MSGTNQISSNRVHPSMVVGSPSGDQLQDRQDIFADAGSNGGSRNTPDFASFLENATVSQKHEIPYRVDVPTSGDDYVIREDLVAAQQRPVQHLGVGSRQPETLPLNLTELSAYEQLHAVRFDSGTLFGHATKTTRLESQTELAKLSQTDFVAKSNSDPRSISRHTLLRHSSLSQLPTQLVSDQDVTLGSIGINSSEIGLYSQYAQHKDASSSKANIPETGDLAGDLRSLPRFLNKSSPKSLVEGSSNGAASEAHGLAEANVGDQPDQALGFRDSAKTYKSAAVLLARLRAATNPTWVAVQNIEQGIRVLARTSRLDPQVRDQLSLDMKTVLAQHGFSVGTKEIVMSEHGFVSTRGGSPS